MTTNDTRQRSVAEIIGWRFVHEYDQGSTPWGYWVNDRTGGMHGDDSISGGPEIDCDDMLRWLADRCESVETWTNYVGEDLCHRVTVWDDGERPVPEITRSTLHAALEAAVRAVAEASDAPACRCYTFHEPMNADCPMNT